jgi:predicted HTH transcriptional regulator
VVAGNEYSMFYNPMWLFLGDEKQPYGTYYHNNGDSINTYWNLYDQVIIRPILRERFIAEAFHYMHIVEAWGTGLPRIINRCKEYGLSEPLFEEFGDGFKATIYRKVSNASEKVSNASEKVSNASEKVSNAPEKVGNTFEKYLPLFEEAGVSDTFAKNIEQVFEQCGTGVPFGQTNVMEWLDCSKSKATNIMNAMKNAKVIEKVKGLGPGKYVFIEM